MNWNRHLLAIASVVLGLNWCAISVAQQAERKTSETKAEPVQLAPAGHMEVPTSEYVPVRREGQPRSLGGKAVRNGYVSVQVNVDSMGNNIVGDAANEPSIAVSPTNPRNMVIGWRQFDTISNSWRQAGYGYTTNGGRDWTFPGAIEPGVFRSDPVLSADTNGYFFYNSLTADNPQTSPSNFRCHVFRSIDGGATWEPGVYAYGGDKQWQVIDLTNGIGQNNIYAFWTRFYTCEGPGCDGHFTRSYDGGASFLPCVDIPGSPQWGTLAVGPNGELYVGGDGFTVVKSSTIQDESLPVQWDFSVTVDLDGSQSVSSGPNPAGLLGQAWIAVDHSGGPTHGNVYLLCSVNRNSISDPLDVMFARSTDGGQTWSAPVRINDDSTDNGAWQWFGTMSVAPNGRIDVIWLDTRNDPGGYDSELYYSSSEDGGLNWTPNEALSPSFDPHLGWPQQNKMGDYFHMRSDDQGADLAYAATFNGEQDVYYIRIGERCSDEGSIELDSPNYGCDSTATLNVNDCGLNTDDGVAETVQVAIVSDSESGGEMVTLLETDIDSGLFEGSIQLREADAVGVLLIAEGDSVTATYNDADDGTGSPATVQATATVDCTPPVISSVATADVGPFDATVTFDTDEFARGTVRYGASCTALTEVAHEAGYPTSHSVTLTGLQEDSLYFYVVDAADYAGNQTTDDNVGSCYSLTTTDVPNYFTEQFAAHDLDNRILTFEPNGSIDFYSGCVENITVLPTDPAGGTTVSLSDDDSVQVSLSGGESVSLYGVSYTSVWIGSNGYLTLGQTDDDYDETLDEHFAIPRVAALYDDLNPSSSGTVSYEQLADRLAVTWLNVPEYNQTSTNTFQIELFFDGTITISYLAVAASDAIVGLSEGTGLPPGFFQTDLSEMGPCGPKPPVAQNGQASTAVSTPVLISLLATDDGLPDPPATLDYIVDTLPDHGTLHDPADGAILSVPYTLLGGGNQVIFEPVDGYEGPDAFLFKANDGGAAPDGGDSTPAVISITIGGPAWTPVASNVVASTQTNVVVLVGLLGNDPNGDPLTFTIESLPAQGYLSDPDVPGVAIESVPYDLPGQAVNYHPPCGLLIAEAFTFTVSDATATSNVATATVTINANEARKVFDFPLDADPGWSTEGEWEYGPATAGGSHNGDPAAAHTGTNIYGYNLGGDYGNFLPARYLTTQVLDCSNMSDVELRFWRWLGVESYPGFDVDHATVEVSTDGTQFDVVWENSGDSIDDDAWVPMTLDLSAYADGQETVYLRWGMGPTDNGVTYPGWNLDDIEVWGAVASSPADFNTDAFVNLEDAAVFESCLAGPDEDLPLLCICVDLDADGDVDLVDFAAFQAVFAE